MGRMFALLAIGVVMILVSHPVSLHAQRGPMFDEEAIDRFIEQQMVSNRVPGLAVAVTSGSDVIYLKGFGMAGDDQPVTPQTRFHIASVSKSITALAVMQLVEAGRIDLDESVQTYLPEFTTVDGEMASRITVRHLLNQTSGLSDLGYSEMALPQPRTIEERIATLRDARFVSEPGTEYHYFNPNYAILARVVEVVSGQPFAVYMQEHIFTPLAMSRTTSVSNTVETPQVAPDLAQGYWLAYGIPIPRDEPVGFLGGSGGVISTAEDMAKFLIMQLNDGRIGDNVLVSPESIALMHTPPDITSSYAMGWIVSPADTLPRVIEHNGIISTFHADAALLPDEGYGIMLLYNQNYIFAGYEDIKRGLIDLLTNGSTDVSGLGAGTIGLLIAGVTVATVVLQVRAWRRVPRWIEAAKGTPVWRRIPGLIWAFVPAAFFVALPWLNGQFTDRVFSYERLFGAMPDLMIWLTLSATLGVTIGVTQLIALAQFHHRQR